jgi:hypothetical protein
LKLADRANLTADFKGFANWENIGAIGGNLPVRCALKSQIVNRKS